MKNTLWVRGLLPALVLGFMVSCAEGPTSNNANTEQDAPVLALAKKGNSSNGGQTGYTSSDSGTGSFAGYNETNCPDYGSYSYTLWAGQSNDAGTVTITNDDSNVYVTYNTNGTADLGEVHVYVWENLEDIPSKRPAPGQAPYSAENINADSYTLTIPMSISCGQALYISTHAALIADSEGDGDDDEGEGSNDGETAYGGGSATGNSGFSGTGGAWWGFVTYTVDCFYDISGTVYEDGDNSGDMESGEATFEGITVNLLDGSGNLVASTTTHADGSYLFEHVAGGADYSVVVAQGPEGDYLANENANGFSISNLSDCQEDVDFGFVPLYDLSGTVYNDANNNADNDGEAGFGGITVTLTDASGNVVATTTTNSDGSYSFENLLPGDYTVSVANGPEGYTATENAGGASVSLNEDTTGVDFGFYMEEVTYDPCDTNQDGTVSSDEAAACDDGNGDGTWGEETAWAGSTAGGGNAWWFYFEVSNGSQQPIYAGQNLVEGAYVTYDANAGTLTITLGDNMRLQDDDESVKIQGYDAIPSVRPSAGLFTGYKGTDLVVQVDEYPYYGIHLDVEVRD